MAKKTKKNIGENQGKLAQGSKISEVVTDKTVSEKLSKSTQSKKTATQNVSNNKDANSSKGVNSHRNLYISILVILILAALIILTYIYLMPQYLGTSLSTFKSNYNSAQRIAIVYQYTNSTEYAVLSQCSINVVTAEIDFNKRNASTIDFFVIDGSSCAYSPSGLGHLLNPNSIVSNTTTCEKVIQSEPSLSFNYSNSNSTIITPYHMQIFGNEKYFAACPIASGIV